jgi:hypothetical protein
MTRRRQPWTADEDRWLVEAVRDLGDDWRGVAERLGNRTTEAVRVYYNQGVRSGRFPEIPKFWTEERDQVVIADFLANVWVEETARKLGATETQVRGRHGTLQRRGQLPRKRIQARVTPHYTEPEAESPAGLWKAAEAKSDRVLAKGQTKHLADVLIEDDRPIALTVMSDQHIDGGGNFAAKRMREDAELCAATEGMYAILGGDAANNHIKHHSAMVRSNSRPSDEWRMFDHYLSIFAPKILAVCTGNHDDWTSDLADVSMVKVLADRHKIFSNPDEVVLTVTLGGQAYTVLVRHQYRFNSVYNETHSVKQLWNFGRVPFDAGVICHKHVPAMEPFIRHGLVRWAARPGSYQGLTSFGSRYGFYDAFPTCPTFILWPGRRDILGLPDIRQAAGYLTYLRERSSKAA